AISSPGTRVVGSIVDRYSPLAGASALPPIQWSCPTPIPSPFRETATLRVLEDHAVLHHEADALGHADVLARVAGHRDDVGEEAGLDLAELVLHADELRAHHRRPVERPQRRHPALDHRDQLAPVLAVREARQVTAARD